ncbi:BglG family transcription antiterminator [Streptococcus sp. DD13]|uniref:BglG family transcription antiterminator n=1 Tax=Streptococcus sp. DD13 TaxID=1777881 RepID=UPI00079454C6|nr:PTS sugar transporter subunit IIA [Streptococcus sp. DD13]KXT78507.1 hypothetical protein STRDD13_00709 [Streptococcus sp. DD13]
MNQRQFNILYQLTKEAEPITGSEFSQQFQVSTKTIYKDIEQINLYLKDCPAYVQKKSSVGILLCYQGFSREKLLAELKKSPYFSEINGVADLRALHLLVDLLLHTQVDILDWSMEHYISEATVRRDLEEIDRLFLPHSVTVQRLNGGIRIEGDEETIRNISRNYFLDCQFLSNETVQNLLITNGELEETLHHIRQCLTKFHFTIQDGYRDYLLLDMLLVKTRSRINKHIKKVKKFNLSNKRMMEVYLLARELLGGLVEEVFEGEIVVLAEALITFGNYEQLYFQSNSPIKRITRQLIQGVGDMLGLDLLQDQYLEQMLLNHIPAMIMRLKNRMKIKSVVTEEVKREYSVLYHVIWLSSHVLKDQFLVELTDTEVAFLTIHFEIALEKLGRPMKIYVVCPHNLATSELLMSQVKRLTGYYQHIFKVECDELYRLNFNSYDLLISAVQLDNVSFPYMHVGSMMSKSDKQLIQNHFLRYSEENVWLEDILPSEEEKQQIMLKKLLGHSIFLNEKQGNSYACIDRLIEATSNVNSQNPQFKESIFRREKMGVTSTYTGIALPHADPKEVEVSELVILTLDRPIFWGQNLVKVVILIAISEQDIDMYKNALLSIYKKVDSSSYIDSLWKSKHLEEFYHRLFSEVVFDSI